MSFAKAKIAKFNEVKEYTPSPTRYNLGVNAHPKKQGGSGRSSPTFQTLTVPKAKKIAKLPDHINKDEDQELEDLRRQLEEKEAKIKQLEENFKEGSLLTEMQTKEKINVIEAIWETKLEEKENELEAALKECQEINEYAMRESEIENNRLKILLEEQESIYNELKQKQERKIVILSRQVEELTQQVDFLKEKNEQLCEHLKIYDNELNNLLKDKEKVESEVRDLKIKHLSDLKVKTSELFKNMDLETKNYKKKQIENPKSKLLRMSKVPAL